MYEINSSAAVKIDYGVTGDEAILQSATFLLSTFLNTCPLHRGFGWEPPVDDPSLMARASASAQIIEMFSRHIPELEIKDIIFEQDDQKGILIARIKVEVHHG
ncbi:hypothetical protein CD798_08525 [Bacillaceae bacterium SAOS 7]|nr:hypothetical protein CD798_08525 [Bacillaceae bacterium SAOS 7]